MKETDDLVLRLYKWSETAPDPLRSYALGLLGASMEIPEVATKYRYVMFLHAYGSSIAVFLVFVFKYRKISITILKC